jgi:choline dehydrogenase-like flavoprotein
MTLIDLESQSPNQTFKADIVIVGAGVAGLVLADALRGSGKTVDVLEAGGATLEADSQSLYDAEMAGVPHKGTTEGRFRVYGGSSTRWGGQLLPLPASDFEHRLHVPYSGWPIKLGDLSPYLTRCEELLGVNHAPYNELLLQQLPKPWPQLSEADLRFRFSKWAPFRFRNLARTLGIRCENDPNTRIFLHAAVTSIDLHRDGRQVENLLVRTVKGGCFHFRGAQVVIAAGSIETSRLLLASRSVHSNGLANRFDQVGRWFHDHLSVKAAVLKPIHRRHFLRQLAPWFVSDTRHTVKIESTEAWQARHSCLNVMGHLVFQAPDNSGFAWLRQQLLARQIGESGEGKVPPPALEQLPAEALDLLYLGWKRIARQRRWCPANAEITLSIDSEQQPNPESRIRLSDNLDALDMPKAVVQWQWGEPERRSFAAYKQLFARQWQAWDAGQIDWRESFDAGSGWEKSVADTYHLMGGTRMATNPQHGVVDQNLQVHGVDNLSIASLSVFPTGGSSNPTFTLMMMTLRLADRLRSKPG